MLNKRKKGVYPPNDNNVGCHVYVDEDNNNDDDDAKHDYHLYHA